MNQNECQDDHKWKIKHIGQREDYHLEKLKFTVELVFEVFVENLHAYYGH